MRFLRPFALALALVASFGVAPAYAQFADVAVISSTLGVNANRLCLGENGTRGDIGCPTYAPYVSATNSWVGIGTNLPLGSLHLKDGNSALVLQNTFDTTSAGAVWALKTGFNGLTFYRNDVGEVSYTVAASKSPMSMQSSGTTVALLVGVAASSQDISGINRGMFVQGKVGIQNFYPSTSLSVSGTMQMRDGGETCDANRAGAMKWNGTEFQVCYGSGGWATLSSAAVSGTLGGSGGGDKIVSGTANVTVNTNGYISLTTGSVNTGYFDTAGRLVVPGISVTTNQTSVTSLYASGNVGIGTVQPSSSLDVYGRITLGKIGETIPLNFRRSSDGGFSTNLGYKDFSATGSEFNVYHGTGQGSFSVSLNLTGAVEPMFRLFGGNGTTLPVGMIVGVSISNSPPSTTLHVSGTLKISDGGQACDVNRAGAIKWNGTEFQVCYGSGGWATLSSAAVSGTLGGSGGGDTITSGTTKVTANTTGYTSFTTGGVETGYMDTAGRLVVPGISVTTLNGISSTRGTFTKMMVGDNAGTMTGMFNMRTSSGADFSISQTVTQFYDIVGGAGDSLGIRINASDQTNSFVVSNSGVGIGTAAPSSSLHVIGISDSTAGGLNIGTRTENRFAIYPLGNSSIAMKMLQTGGTLAMYNSAGAAIYALNNTSRSMIVGASGTPSSTFHVVGTLRIADGGETCDADRAGAVKWNGTQFQVCYGSGGWALLSSAAVSGTSGAPESLGVTDLSDSYASTTLGALYIGDRAGISYSTTVTESTAVGIGALRSNLTGTANTAFGNGALYTTSSGGNNTAVGRWTLYLNTTGSGNTAMGVQALGANTTGISNVGVGSGAMGSNTIGQDNTVMGTNAAYNAVNANSNVAVGRSALFYNQNGSSNVAIGRGAAQGTGAYSVTGTVAVGQNAGGSLATNGNYNTLVGFSAGVYLTSGANNILLGYQVSTPLVTSSNYLNIGNSIYGDMTASASAVGGASKIGINFVTPTQALEVSGTVSATRFVGDGSLLTGIAASGGDNITSGTTNVTANTTGYISLTTGGTNTGYFDTAGRLVVPGISVTTNQTSFTSIYASQALSVGTSGVSSYTIHAWGVTPTIRASYSINSANYAEIGSGATGGFLRSYPDISLRPNNIEAMRIMLDGRVGIGNSNPSSTLHVNGAINFSQDSSATLNTCDTNRAGAMRWNGTQFQVCYGSGGWAMLSSAAVSGTSGGASAIDGLSDAAKDVTNNNLSLGEEMPVLVNNQYNTAVGVGVLVSLSNSSGGDNNTGLGYKVLVSTTTGSDNVGIGWKALFNNTTGSYNMAIGSNALGVNTTGFYNMAIGSNALGGLINGNNNTSVGFDALSVAIGSYNTALGSSVAVNTGSASYNTLIGAMAGGNGISLRGNTFVGFNAGAVANAPTSNTIIGGNAAVGIISGTMNLILGAQTLSPTANTSYFLNIGNAISGTMLGGSTSSLTFIGGLKANGVVTATYFEGDGSRLTGIAGGSSDRISSGTTNVTVNSATSIISITTAGVNTGYFDGSGRLVVPGISVTTLNGVSSTNGYFSNNVGIGLANPATYATLQVSGSIITGAMPSILTANTPLTIKQTGSSYSSGLMMEASGGSTNSTQMYMDAKDTLIISRGLLVSGLAITMSGYTGVGTTEPSTTLDVSGSIQISQDSSSTTNTCDTNRAGAMRWNGTQFQVCYGSGGWALLSSAAVSGTLGGGSGGDSIVSGTSSVSIVQDQSVTIKTAGTTRMTITTAGNVGIGTSSPSSSLHIATDNQGMYMGTNSNNDTYTSYNDRGYIGYNSGWGSTVIQGASGKGIQFGVNNNSFGSGRAMQITSGSLVGIGTIVPSTTLDVSGTMRATSTASSCTATTYGAMRYNTSSGKMEICRVQ